MEANFSVMTTIPICQDLELLIAPFLNSQLTLLTHLLRHTRLYVSAPNKKAEYLRDEYSGTN